MLSKTCRIEFEKLSLVAKNFNVCVFLCVSVAIIK